MRPQLVLLLAVFLCLKVSCTSFRHVLQSAACLQRPLENIQVEPKFNYYAQKEWSGEEAAQVENGQLQATQFIQFYDFDKQDHQPVFVTQLQILPAKKFDQRYRPLSNVKSNRGAQFGFSRQQFQEIMGSKAAGYQVHGIQAIITLKFEVKGAPKQLGGWSLLLKLVSLKNEQVLETELEQQKERVSELIQRYKLNSGQVVQGLQLNAQELAKHIMLSLKNPPELNTAIPVQFQASIVVLQAGQKFILSPIEGQMYTYYRIIDQVKDRSKCSS